MIVLTSGLSAQNVNLNEGDGYPNNYKSPWSRFKVNAGVQFAGYNSGITLGGDGLGVGLTVDMEKLLGLETTLWSFRGDGQFRFGKLRNNELSFSFLNINRRAFKEIDKEIVLGDYTIPINTRFETRSKVGIYKLKYTRAFYQDNRVSLGGAVGVYLLPISFSVEVLGRVEKNEELFAPLPIFGLTGDFIVNDDLIVHQNLDMLYLVMGGFTGSILDFDFNIEYRPFENVGIGLGVNSANWRISSENYSSGITGISLFGNMSMGYTGLYLMGTVQF